MRVELSLTIFAAPFQSIGDDRKSLAARLDQLESHLVEP
jgi:hypothetical protein